MAARSCNEAPGGSERVPHGRAASVVSDLDAIARSSRVGRRLATVPITAGRGARVTLGVGAGREGGRHRAGVSPPSLRCNGGRPRDSRQIRGRIADGRSVLVAVRRRIDLFAVFVTFLGPFRPVRDRDSCRAQRAFVHFPWIKVDLPKSGPRRLSGRRTRCL